MARVAITKKARADAREEGVLYHRSNISGIELILSRARIALSYPWHFHVAHWTAGLVLSGDVSVETRETARRLRRGRSFIVAPCEVHRIEVARGSRLAVICVDSSGAKTPAMLLRGLRDGLARAEKSGVLLPGEVARIEKLWRRVLAGRLEKPAGEGLARASEARTSVRAVMELLMRMPEEVITVAQMSAMVGCSPWHFLRRFKGECGMTPHAFQLGCRLRRARVLLRKEMTAAAVAAEAGFADQSHLIRVFKQHHCMTPRRFLRANSMLGE